MLRPPHPVSPRVKRSLLILCSLLACSLLACSTALAAEEAGPKVDPKVDRLVRDSLPVCADAKVSYQDLGVQLPARFKGTLVRVESQRPSCEGMYAAVFSPLDGFYLGMPFPLAGSEGATMEEKLKNFIWNAMQMNVTVAIEKKPTDDGLLPVTLYQATENGKMPLEGEIDPKGTTFFFGHFRHLAAGDSMRAQRTKAFSPFFASLPVKGPADAAVTVIEFSDFECPSCKRASGYLEPILEKHGNKVRYVRFDLPLTMHPWAFPAALAGRAILRQKPEAFWDYKKQVYANQDTLTAFTFWDFARGFAQDHELDLKRYDADLQDETLKSEILKGAGFALANEVRFTPTYLVNGAFVDPGDGGKQLAEYVDKLLAGK